jgi:hypothetical protein
MYIDLETPRNKKTAERKNKYLNQHLKDYKQGTFTGVKTSRIRGRRCQFSTIFCQLSAKTGVFLKKQCYDPNFAKTT